MTEFDEQQQYAAALDARNDELTRLDVWRDRALKSEQLLRQCVADYESAVVYAATLKEALNLTQSFKDDAQRSARYFDA